MDGRTYNHYICNLFKPDSCQKVKKGYTIHMHTFYVSCIMYIKGTVIAITKMSKMPFFNAQLNYPVDVFMFLCHFLGNICFFEIIVDANTELNYIFSYILLTI